MAIRYIFKCKQGFKRSVCPVPTLILLTFLLVPSCSIRTPDSPEAFAKAWLNGNWKSLYSVLSVHQSEWLSEELFLKAMSDRGEIDYEKYVITELNGILPQPTALTTRYELSYTLKGRGIVRRMYFSKISSDGRNLYVIEDMFTSIAVIGQKGVKVTIDGIDISVGEKQYADSASTPYRYSTPEIFAGRHIIEVTHDGCVPFTREIDVNTPRIELTADLAFTLDLKNELMAKSGEQFKTIWAAALADWDYESLELSIPPDFSGAAKQEYVSLKDSMAKQTGFEFKKIEDVSMQSSLNNDGSAKVSIRGYYSRDPGFGLSKRDFDTVFVFTYVFHEGSWILNSIDLSTNM